MATKQQETTAAAPPTELADIKLGKAISKSATLVGLPVFSDRLDVLDGVTPQQLERDGFTGKAGSVLTRAGEGQTMVLVGMGESTKVSAKEFRRGSAGFIRVAAGHEKLAFALDEVLSILEDNGSAEGASVIPAPEVVAAVSEGILLGSYRFGVYKKPAKGQPTRRTVTVAVGERARSLGPPMTRARVVSRAVSFARDLVNEPGGALTPTVFAARAADRAKELGVKAEVMDAKAIARARLGGLIAVNQGSSEPPRMVKLTYSPQGTSGSKAPTVCLVGKGITFDSGGLSIKPGGSMETMKNDMAGAGAVIAAVFAVAELKLPIKVVTFTPMTDNMTGGGAQRPGDIYTARNGKTVEVLNTDAEGRLVLGEALTLASEQKPDAIVDLATLTGACLVALGQKIAGLMGNDDALVDRIKSAAASAGERVWHLPLPDDYRSGLDSKVADIKNIAGRYGGTLTAGLFLKEFVADDIPWAHIDIAGPAYLSDDDAENPAGGTGFGVRTLVRLIEDWN